jgi:hypothetical protein
MPMMEFLLVAAVVVGIPFFLFGMSDGFRFNPRPIRSDDFAGWLVRIKPWQVALTTVLIVLMFLAMNAPPRSREGFFLFGGAIVVVALFLRAWRSEFLFLMGLRDDDFPGRYDKLIWSVVLTAFAPVGLWFFRSYHLAHWPEPEPKPDHARTAPEAL